MSWYFIIGIFLIIAVAIGVAMYYCNSKDHPKRPYSALATLLVPVFGQLGARMFTVSSGKGMAQKWLLFPLFFIPPFSAVPAWFVYNDMEYC